MNLSLIDPFDLAQDYPDTLTDKLSTLQRLEAISITLVQTGIKRDIGSGHATCLRFNRRGDFLASGRVGS